MPNDRVSPLESPTRIAPVVPTVRVAPLPASGAVPLYVYPGSSKFCRLGETVRPFSDCYIKFDGTATLSTLTFRKNAEAFAGVTIGTYPDLVSAARYITFTAVGFGTTTYDLKATDSGGVIVTVRTTIHTDVRIGDWRLGPGNIPAKSALVDEKIRPFADAEFSLPGATENDYLDTTATYQIDAGAPVVLNNTPDGLTKEIKKFSTSWGSASMRTLTINITDNATPTTASASVKVFIG